MKLLFGCPQNITKNKMKYFWLRRSYKVGKECQEKEPKATLDLNKTQYLRLRLYDSDFNALIAL